MIWETVILALRAIRRNVLRSFLTILGIVIGVAAVITMVTLGDGATEQVRADISSLGSNMLQVRPGQGFRGPGGVRIAAERFKIADVHAIEREIYGLEAVAPISDQAAQAIYGNRNWATSVMGSTNDYLAVRDWPLSEGRVFTEGELHSGRAVCILGSTVVRELFGDQDPLGAFIRLDRLSCQVVGVLASKGQSSFGQDQDDMVLVPLKTLQRRIMGSTDVEAVMVSASDGVSTQAVREDIERLMRERRKIAPDKDDDFHVRDMQEIVSTLTSTTRVLTALLGAVAAVSLLVGGIGIMNIMLVSVTERTREIGTRLAIGALEREVLMQFLIEAVVLSSLGGVFGIILGLSAAALGAHLLMVPFVLNPGIIAVAFLFSATVGVVFGFFPARQAARMDPIEALRHE
ncbi:MAG TPA: ABC transporter permease [Desulfomonilia bacterium]|nr:ABC transporter permease [Deltaproteobacteria bacterium]HPX49648.1 ABC transporter permease [Deltaproteobacteria bacterium]HQA70975.1 ABC transporter permease [Deltaproteobacteria bacterium]HRR22184.1 ABC transporter permease [Desulfomonilia bacterium]HRR69915.1 ABC transporter permease [Desulfomonilia bacterium]